MPKRRDLSPLRPHLPDGAFGDHLYWLDDWLSERGILIGIYDSLHSDEPNNLLKLSKEAEKNWTRRDRVRRNEIMAKFRRAHPDHGPEE
jgi:hypothetical protein